MRIKAALIAALLLVGMASPSNAQVLSTAPDSVLGRARAEILAMPEPQVRSLLGYLSECDGRSRAAQACNAARSRYSIEFSKPGSAVDTAIDDSEKFLNLKRIIDGGVPPATIETDVALKSAVRESLQKFRH